MWEVQGSVSSNRMFRQIILPGIFPVGIVILTAALIVTIGEILLNLFDPTVDEIKRPELWVATGAALAILAVAGVLSTRPAGSLGKLDEPLMIGKRPLLADPLPPVDMLARRGLPGTVEDLAPGFALYARNGQLGIAREILRGVPGESGQFRQGFVYAQGVFGANDQMWIPIEAISAVYPQTQSAFIAIAGDEIEAYGWENPPASFNLRGTSHENKLY